MKKFDIHLDEGESMTKKKAQDAAPKKDESIQEIPTKPVRRSASGSKLTHRNGRQPIGKKTALASMPIATATIDIAEQMVTQLRSVNTATREPHASAFDAAITLDGMLTLSVEGQSMQLSPEQTRKLAKMIKFAAD